MDIHKPKAAHSLREFLVEIGTITVGILIALGLEAAVEAHQNRELVDRVRVDLRDELRRNRGALASTVAQEKAADAPLEALSQYMGERLRGGRTTAVPKAQLTLALAPLRTAAWEGTTASQALTHMPYEETRALTRAYAGTRIVNQYQDDAVRHLLGLTAFTADPASLSPEEVRSAKRELVLTGVYLQLLTGTGEQLLQAYDQALKTME